MAVFLVFVLATGCAKKLTAPEVEAPSPEPVSEAAPASEEAIAESVFEDQGFGIEEQPSEPSGEFYSESPEAPPMEEAPVEEPPQVAESPGFGEATAPSFDGGSAQSDFSSDQNFDMGGIGSGEAFESGAYEAPPENVEEPAQTFGETTSPGSFDTFGSSEPPPAVEAETAVTQEARLLSFKSENELQDIHFEFDRYDLDENSRRILQANAEWLKNNPSAKVEIQGHCDERGTNNYNLGLGERRALSTKKFLVQQGVPEDRLFTISYGEEKPFCFESNESCWFKNRRAHFMVAE